MTGPGGGRGPLLRPDSRKARRPPSSGWVPLPPSLPLAERETCPAQTADADASDDDWLGPITSQSSPALATASWAAAATAAPTRLAPPYASVRGNGPTARSPRQRNPGGVEGSASAELYVALPLGGAAAGKPLPPAPPSAPQTPLSPSAPPRSAWRRWAAALASHDVDNVRRQAGLTLRAALRLVRRLLWTAVAALAVAAVVAASTGALGPAPPAAAKAMTAAGSAAPPGPAAAAAPAPAADDAPEFDFLVDFPDIAAAEAAFVASHADEQQQQQQQQQHAAAAAAAAAEPVDLDAAAAALAAAAAARPRAPCDRGLVYVLCDGPGFGRCFMDYVHAVLFAAATNRSLTVIDRYWNYRCAVNRGLDCYFLPPPNPIVLTDVPESARAVERAAWARQAVADADELTRTPVALCPPEDLARRIIAANRAAHPARAGRAEAAAADGVGAPRAALAAVGDGSGEEHPDEEAEAEDNESRPWETTLDRHGAFPIPFLTDGNAFDPDVPWVLCNRDHMGPMDRWVTTRPRMGMLLASRRVLAQLWRLRPELEYFAQGRRASAALAPLAAAPVYVGVHIRSGDKRSQNRLLHADLYMRRAAALLETWAQAPGRGDGGDGTHGSHRDGLGRSEPLSGASASGGAIFVASDNVSEIVAAREGWPTYVVTSIYGREGEAAALAAADRDEMAFAREGHDQQHFNRLPFAARGKRTLHLLLELQLLADATWFVGTFSSALGRLVQCLRWGRAPQTAYSLDIPWQPN